MSMKKDLKRKSKKQYLPPELKEVWNEDIGMKGTFLLEL